MSILPSCSPSIPSLIKSCKNLIHLQQLHAHIIRKGLEQDHFVISHFLSLSSTSSSSTSSSPSSSLPYTFSIFDRLLSPSTVLYNILIKILSQQKPHSQSAISVFIRMKRSHCASPDRFTYPSLLKSCSHECSLTEGEMIHGSAVRCGVSDDVFVGSGLIDFYGKCKETLCARKVFDGMSDRNVVSWTAMVVGYVNVGDLVNAEKVFKKMPERNLASWNAMVDGLAKAGDMLNARHLFDEMPKKDVVSFTVMIDGYAKAGDMASARALFEKAPERDIVAWSALISGYAQNGKPEEAVKMFSDMESSNVKPDEFIMVSLMSVCSQIRSLDYSKWADSYLSPGSIDIGQQHVTGARIDMSAKCGNMDGARKLFEQMPKRDMTSYCSMIQGLSIHGLGDEAVGLFNRMLNEGLVPDEVALTVILAACSQGRLVQEGLHYFATMINKYSLAPAPEHYACMVDLLGRTGQLKEAYDLLKSMPVEPDACAWGALLGACAQYSDVELGKVVAGRLFELEPQNAGNYVLLSNIYASANQWSHVSLIRDEMTKRGLRKIPGCSSAQGSPSDVILTSCKEAGLLWSSRRIWPEELAMESNEEWFNLTRHGRLAADNN